MKCKWSYWWRIKKKGENETLQKSKSNRRAWMWLTVLLILFMLISYFFLSKVPKQYPHYVSESPSPTGVKGFYTYLQQETDVKRWTHSPNLLKNSEDGQVLIIVEPYFIPEQKEIDAYQHFMEAGNTILLFMNNPKGMLNIETEMVGTNLGSVKVFNNQGNTYHAEINTTVRLQTNHEDEILLKDGDGTLALKRSFGKGQLIASVSPEWLINSKLEMEDHIPLLISLVNEGNGQVFLFDEHIHGGQNAPTALTLYPKWFLLMLLQGCLLVILFLWINGKRFGPIIVPREETVRFSDEGLKALASWFKLGKLYKDSLMIQADYIKQLMHERWGISINSDWNELSAYFAKMVSIDSKHFINDLKIVLEKDKLSKQEYLLWSRRLDRLRKEVEEG